MADRIFGEISGIRFGTTYPDRQELARAGRRGFSLETQRREIVAFAASEGFMVKSWYQDVQTGGGVEERPRASAGIPSPRLARSRHQTRE